MRGEDKIEMKIQQTREDRKNILSVFSVSMFILNVKEKQEKIGKSYFLIP